MLNHVVVCYRPHTFSPRPAAAALAALRCSDGLRSNTLLIVWALANVARPDMQAYPSLRPLARCLIILVAMGGCPQTCMIKLRIASCSALPQCSTHSHPAPLQARDAPLPCSVLMCGRSQMSAKPDMPSYPALRPLARCLIILAGTLTEKPAAGGGR